MNRLQVLHTLTICGYGVYFPIGIHEFILSKVHLELVCAGVNNALQKVIFYSRSSCTIAWRSDQRTIFEASNISHGLTEPLIPIPWIHKIFGFIFE